MAASINSKPKQENPVADEPEKLSLINLKDGAAVEKFDRAIDQVMDNISDINTTLKDREIKLIVKFKPAKDRSYVAYSIFCDPKLQSQEPETAMALIKLDGKGRSFAVGHKTKQQEIPFGNVTSITGKGEKIA